MPAKHAKPKIVTNIATGSPWRKKILFTNMLTKDRHKKGRQKWHKHGRQTYMTKNHKKLLMTKGKKIYSAQKCSHTKYLACLYCSGFSQLLDLEQRLFHAGLLLFKMAQFHFTHSEKF